MEFGFSVDTHVECVRNINISQVIARSESWIAAILILENKPLGHIEILQMMDSNKQ